MKKVKIASEPKADAGRHALPCRRHAGLSFNRAGQTWFREHVVSDEHGGERRS